MYLSVFLIELYAVTAMSPGSVPAQQLLHRTAKQILKTG